MRNYAYMGPKENFSGTSGFIWLLRLSQRPGQPHVPLECNAMKRRTVNPQLALIAAEANSPPQSFESGSLTLTIPAAP